MTGAAGQAGRIDDRLVAEARGAQSLVSMAAKRVKLARSGNGWKGLCPFHEEKTPSFFVTDRPRSGDPFFHCYGCGAHGSAIDWLIECEGLGFVEAVKSLLGGVLPDGRTAVSPAQREAQRHRVELVSSSEAGRWIWNSAGPARGDLPEKWLEARGCDPAAQFLPGDFAIDQLRYHARCPIGVWRVGQHPEEHFRTAPAMVAPIRDAAGLVWGVHVTFLTPDGRRKADLGRDASGQPRPARKMFGKVAGHAVRLASAAWPTSWEGYMTQRDTSDARRNGSVGRHASQCATAASVPTIIVGEGIETCWSFAQAFGRPCVPCAALSLANLQGRAVKLKDGSLPLWNLRADPEGPPFLIERAGEVTLLVDADMKPLKDQKVQRAKGAQPERAMIDGETRARICAAIASQHWTAAGARSVTPVRPAMGNDFNDEVMAA